MRKHHHHLLGAPVAATLLALAAAAAPAAATEGGLGRPEAEASFASYDASGCVATQVDLFVRGAAAAGGAARPRLDLAVSRVDECRDVELVRAKKRIALPPGAFHVAPDLGAATLETVATVPDKLSGKSLTLNITLVWAASEDAVTAPVAAVAEGLGEVTRVRAATERTMRLAGASGTITSGAVNFTPAPATDAALSRTSAGRRLGVGR
jgi:hypothetical protein